MYTEDKNEPIAKIAFLGSKEWIKIKADTENKIGVKPLYFTFEGKGYIDIKDFSLL